MAIKNIITDVDKLRVVCDPCICRVEAAEVAQHLIDTAENRGPLKCLGLAAPQIGYNLRIFVMLYQGVYVPIIDPEMITVKGPKDYKKEGCLSRPGVNVRVGRYKRIQVKYLGNESRKFSNMNARVFQHELNHLNGIVI